MRLIDADALKERAEVLEDFFVTAWTTEKVQRLIHDAPTIDAVPVGVLDQVRWERDVAIAQLKDYGVSFGEKADCAKVVRCKDCKYWRNASKPLYCSEFMGDCTIDDEPVGRWEHDFCSYGERRSE